MKLNELKDKFKKGAVTGYVKEHKNDILLYGGLMFSSALCTLIGYKIGTYVMSQKAGYIIGQTYERMSDNAKTELVKEFTNVTLGSGDTFDTNLIKLKRV